MKMQKAELEVVKFSCEDVIATSAPALLRSGNFGSANSESQWNDDSNSLNNLFGGSN